MREVLAHQLRALERLRFKLRTQQQIAAAEDHLGVSRGYLRRKTYQLKEALIDGARLRPGIELSILLGAADFLGEAPHEFFDEVLDPQLDGEPSPVERFRSLVEGRPEPVIVQAVTKMPRAEPLATEEDLDAVDEERYDDPKAGLRDCEELAQRVPVELAPTLVGIYGSCLRCLHRHREAAAAIMAAFRLAARLEAGPAIFGDLMQRAGVVAAYRGKYALSLALADAALVQHACGGNTSGEVSALIGRGVALQRIGRHREGLIAIRASLKRSQRAKFKRRQRFEFIAYFQLAHCFAELDDLDAALRAAGDARRRAQAATSPQLLKLHWLEARVFSAVDRSEEAAERYRRLVEELSDPSPIDAGLAGAELVRLHLHSGQASEARETALSLFALLKPLEKTHEIAAGALSDLLRLVTSRRRIDTAMLDELISTFKRARSRC